MLSCEPDDFFGLFSRQPDFAIYDLRFTSQHTSLNGKSHGSAEKYAGDGRGGVYRVASGGTVDGGGPFCFRHRRSFDGTAGEFGRGPAAPAVDGHSNKNFPMPGTGGSGGQVGRHLSSGGGGGSGTGDDLGPANHRNQSARDAVDPGCREREKDPDTPDLDLGGLWEKREGGVCRRGRSADRTAPSEPVELCLLEGEGGVSRSG